MWERRNSIAKTILLLFWIWLCVLKTKQQKKCVCVIRWLTVDFFGENILFPPCAVSSDMTNSEYVMLARAHDFEISRRWMVIWWWWGFLFFWKFKPTEWHLIFHKLSFFFSNENVLRDTTCCCQFIDATRWRCTQLFSLLFSVFFVSVFIVHTCLLRCLSLFIYLVFESIEIFQINFFICKSHAPLVSIKHYSKNKKITQNDK